MTAACSIRASLCESRPASRPGGYDANPSLDRRTANWPREVHPRLGFVRSAVEGLKSLASVHLSGAQQQLLELEALRREGRKRKGPWNLPSLPPTKLLWETGPYGS